MALRERIRQSSAPNTAILAEPQLDDFVSAARAANSASDALQLALNTLSKRLEAASAVLFEHQGDRFRPVATYPAGREAPSLPENGFLANRFRFYSAAIPISSEDLDSWQHWAKEHKPEQLAEIESLAQLEVRLAAPLKNRNEIAGLLLVGPSVAAELKNWPHMLALMLENGRLTDRVLEQEKISRDLALAAEVQKRLLPEGYPDSDAAEFAAFTLPARSVGGDYYDFLRINDTSVGIALADVAGKGVPAALIMSVVQASLRILASEGNAPLPQIVAKLNRFLYRSTGVSSYATFFYAQLNETTRELRYVNAGHNPPVLVRLRSEQTSLEDLATGGMIIGMFSQAEYQEAHLMLDPGDVLVAFTDGVTEAMNEAEEEFGDERLKALLCRIAHLPAKNMAEELSVDLKNWIGDAPQHDDLTFLILKTR